MLKKCLILAVGAAFLQSAPVLSAPANTHTADDKRPIGLQDVLDWKSIQIPLISNSGDWFAYQLVPGEGDGEVVIRATKNDKESRFPIGEAPSVPPRRSAGPSAPPANLAFTDDSQWVAFTIYPTREETERFGTGALI